MATGDILSVEVRSDGWSCDVTIEGFTTGATYDFGTLDDQPSTTATPKFSLSVTSEGYDGSGNLGTVVRTVYGTEVVRKPYPDEADNDETVSGSDLVVRVALSDFVYNDDKSGGAGTSGTNPTATISAAWATNTGGGSETSAAVSGGAVTNSSTLDYPKVIGQWDHIAGVCTADRVKADFAVAFNARHRSGIAAVRFDATGQTSSANVNGTVTSETKTQRSATSLYATAYQTSLAIAGFTQGELIDLRARAYPVVGDADSILDTNSFTTSTDECLGYNKATIKCDKSDLLDDIVYVSTTGNDSTGDGSSGNPWATIGKGIQTGNIVYLQAGTHNIGATHTRVTTSEWIVVQPAPGETASTVGVKLTTTKTYRCERLRIHGVTMTLTDTGSWLDGEHAGNFLRFTNCVWDSSGVGTPTTGPGYRSHCCYIENSTGDLGITTWSLTGFSTARTAYQFDGCEFNDPSATVGGSATYRGVACDIVGRVSWIERTSTNIAPLQDNVMFEFNRWSDFDSTTLRCLLLCDAVVSVARGVSVCGNLMEKTAATSPAVQICADSNAVDGHHIILWHNTVAGERCNLGYNETGSTARYRNNWSDKFNSFRDWNNKDDTFGTPNAARIGSWPVGYGVGYRGNHHEIENFPGEYPGIDRTTGSPGYVDDQSYTTAGSGNGDYTPDTGSALINRVPSGGRVLICDLFGTDIPADGTGCAGAVQRMGSGGGGGNRNPMGGINPMMGQVC